MHTPTTADLIWNRACQGGGGSTRPGDVLLAALLYFHGAAMNGGVLHAVGFCSRPKLRQAKLGYEYLGLAPVVALISKAEGLIRDSADLGDFERELDDAYGAAAADSILFERFQQMLLQDAADFEPVQ